MKAPHPLVAVAIRLAADASQTGHHAGHGHGRTLVKRSLIDELRRELDLLGLGEDWRTLHKVVRIEERQPAEAS